MEESKEKINEYNSYFDGGLLELVGLEILSFFITVFSLGFAASWGQCMIYSYKINHTVYNGRRLKFEGTGGELFIHRMKALFFILITLGIYTIITPVKRTRWVISKTHFEGEELSKDKSFFDGKTIQLIGINMITTVLNISSFGLLTPFSQCYKLRWINKHTTINNEKFSFNGKAIELFGMQILWALLTFVTLGIFVFWIPIKMQKWQTKHTRIKAPGEKEDVDNSLYISIIILIIGIMLFNFVVPKVVNYISNMEIVRNLK